MHPVTWRRRPLALVALSAVLLSAGACGEGGDRGEGATGQSPNDEPSIVHVHGLGLNPADDKLYAATHTGLYRIGRAGRAERVSRFSQDTMGFTVLGPNHFAGSGHPDVFDERLYREGRPPLLGLVESTDAGRTWAPLSLLGEVDFHALVFAHDLVYGYDATGQRLMVSSDLRRWETRGTGIALADLAVSPEDPDLLVAGLESGTATSDDGGRTWKPIEGAPALIVVDWSTAHGLVGATSDGTIFAGPEPAQLDERGALGGPPAALLLTDEAWFAAVVDGTILRTTDGGRTWDVFYDEGAHGDS